jgi:acyl-coenzyme A synthetase/AMP-(fatty) acid ligase
MAVPATACVPVAEGPQFVRALSRFGDSPAVIAPGAALTYRELDAWVDEAMAALPARRSVIPVPAANTLRCLVSYLAALRAGHVVMMVPPCRESLAGEYRAAVELHPDLAMLLPTSGSTGSPKVVRLSGVNLESNAHAIAEALRLRGCDRAITSLSPAYSYGLSVLNSHLAVGACLVLSEASVTDPGFWTRARAAGVTTLAGVPYTFELLDRLGFDAGRDCPTLRLLTCAGGRLPAERVRDFADRGARQGWALAVMYGQTEATARMAVLTPELAAEHPSSVGLPIPGGSFEIRDPDREGVGEVVYRGPNVMMGYATRVEDLSRGPDLAELRTGDRGRMADGLLHIEGRTSRFAKVRGLRVDLDDVERALEPLASACVELPEALGVVVDGDPFRAAAVVRETTGLPPVALRVLRAPLPRFDNGKTDRVACREMLQDVPAPGDGSGSLEDRLVRAYDDVLAVPVTPDDSFASLGGDSLSYVAASVAVERVLGDLPHDWHLRSVRDLARDGRPAGRGVLRLRHAETSVVLRAVSILLVVASHAAVIDIRGGAHLLMALVGYNFARFQATAPAPPWRSLARFLVPSMAWVTGVAVVAGSYSTSALGLAWLTHPVQDTPDWRYWFIGALVWVLPLAVMALSLPAFRGVLRRRPFAGPLAAAGAAYLGAVVVVPDARPSSLFSPVAVLWVFLLGWAVAAADGPARRAVASAVVLLVVPLTFAESRVWVVAGGLLVLVWVRRVALPGWLVQVAAAVAQASLIIYLTHWQVLEVVRNEVALIASVSVGLAVSALMARMRRWRASWAVPAPRAAVSWGRASLRVPLPQLR